MVRISGLAHNGEYLDGDSGIISIKSGKAMCWLTLNICMFTLLLSSVVPYHMSRPKKEFLRQNDFNVFL